MNVGADRQIALLIAPCVIGLVSCSSDTQRPKDPSNCLRVVYSTGHGFAEIRAKRVRTISDRQFRALDAQACGLPLALSRCSGEVTVSALTYTVSEAECGPWSGAMPRSEAQPLASEPEGASDRAQASAGPPERVVEQYFIAQRASDTDTLTSFATVLFDQRVESYKIVSVGPETRAPATLPDLLSKRAQIEADFAKNRRDAGAWGNDLDVYPRLDQVRTLEQMRAEVPPALEPIRKTWAAFNDKDRQLKEALAEAKAAIEYERRIATLSLGQLDDIETLRGDVITRDVEINMTVAGQAKPYVMSLRRYDVAGATGARLVSRWVVFGLTPKY